MLTYKML